MNKLLVFLLFAFLSAKCHATWDQGLYTRDSGRSVQTEAVAIGTTTVVAINTQSFDYVNMSIFNNSIYTVWIGTNTSTLATTGYPLQSSTTYKLDGKFTGIIYGLTNANAGSNTADIRVLEHIFVAPK